MKDFFGMFLFLIINGLIVGAFGIVELYQNIPYVAIHCKGIIDGTCIYLSQIPIIFLICSISLLIGGVWILYNKPCYSDEIKAEERKKYDSR